MAFENLNVEHRGAGEGERPRERVYAPETPLESILRSQDLRPVPIALAMVQGVVREESNGVRA